MLNLIFYDIFYYIYSFSQYHLGFPNQKESIHQNKNRTDENIPKPTPPETRHNDEHQ